NALNGPTEESCIAPVMRRVLLMPYTRVGKLLPTLIGPPKPGGEGKPWLFAPGAVNEPAAMPASLIDHASGIGGLLPSGGGVPPGSSLKPRVLPSAPWNVPTI